MPDVVIAEADDCPYCKLPFEIAAVKFRLLTGSSVLLVCSSCGFARPEETRRKADGQTRARAWTVARPRSSH
jgi:hypothetical protein